MLRYEVKLGLGNLKKSELVWREKYLSPDLSFVTGVTDASYCLDKFKALPSSNSINNTDGTLYVDAHNVQRQGFIVVEGKKYEEHKDVMFDYSVDKSGSEVPYNYIVVNGKYIYNKDGKYAIPSFLVYDGANGLVEEKTLETGGTRINTVCWIEDGKVTIDGNEYVYDRYEGDNGVLKYSETGVALKSEEITDCTSISFHPYDFKGYYDVTKFKLTKSDELTKDVSGISFVRYHYYVLYKNRYCGIRKKDTEDGYSFVCDIPRKLLDMKCTVDNEDEPIEFNVYYADDVGDDYDTLSEMLGNDKYLLNSKNYSIDTNVERPTHNIKELDEVKTMQCFVWLRETDCLAEVKTGLTFDNVFLKVCNDIMNANSGDYIGVHLEDEHAPLKIGDILTFRSNDSDDTSLILPIYNSSEYNGKNELFAVYKNAKYPVIDNLCDKVLINGEEYDIDYINGKVASADCLVRIDDEDVPFKVANGNQIERYGTIVYEGKLLNRPKYDVVQYSGITVNGKNYQVVTKKTGDNEFAFAKTDLRQEYLFQIDDIKGSSLYICTPYTNSTEFTDDFKRYIMGSIIGSLMANRQGYDLIIKNKIFGEEEITSTLAFRDTMHPTSSDDYYDLFNDLKIYVDTAYIQLPIQFSNNAGIDGLRDNITQRDFYEAEKKKAINSIVDMEKDVYAPKYFDGPYKGSETVFKPISDININFHFRTRNLSNWKVNDGVNNIEYAKDGANEGEDNWFITDIHPYVDILKESTKSPMDSISNKKWAGRKNWGEVLQETSDLMGLLYFTNDDIFYQRDKVGRSFARLSFYDSTDPQTQSLLATSCVFVDEHALFKKYIDNSRKNVYEYVKVTPPVYKEDEDTGFIDPSPQYSPGDITHFDGENKEDIAKPYKLNKVSVMSEFINKKSKKNTNKFDSFSNDSGNVWIDEKHRISSRLTISNKYLTDTSSEGYYIYIFREYSEELHPKPIYMKVEFNHAGIGKTIPFLMPMYWSEDAETNTYTPHHTLRLDNSFELGELKKGIPLEGVYAQTYIPLYAVYDFKNKEYAYVFDDRYVTRGEDGTVNLNLFEMKIMDESIVENKEKLEKDIEMLKKRRQRRYLIDVNTEQFPINDVTDRCDEDDTK